MRTRNLATFAVLTALICVLCSAAHVTAGKGTVGLDGRIHGLDFSKSVPHQLNYQGYLVDATDSVAVTATLQMTFRLFDSQAKGAELWSETHPAVEVSSGLFQVLLGSVTPFPGDLFDGSPMWLQTEVGAEILSPRKPLVSVAYGMRAQEADRASTADHATHADTAAFSHTAAAGLADSAAVAENAYQLESQTLADLDGRWVNEGQASSITGDMIIDGQIMNADISAGATIDPSKISGMAWTANNDGAGSGLDADLLDGQEASAFLSTASDYGRSGVADSLFEGATKLSEKYLGITAQAVDADKLDGLDSSAFADSAHLHDDRYYTEDELSTSGTINDASNPVDWTKLKSVPAGFADGTDDVGAGGGISQILEGDGIAVTDPMGPTTTIAAEFGSGSTQVARGDHDHDVVYVNEGQASSITGDMIIDGQIMNADVSAGAVIDPSKISGIAWTANNDGAGSGLDADLLDGQEAAAFMDTTNDYGRSAVADSLYEGTTALADKYLGKTDKAADSDQLDGMDSAAFSDTAHQHDDRYYTEDELSTSGTINDASNPVDWTKLKSVPAGFADGTDDVGAGGGISQIVEGDGIAVTNPTGPTTTIAVDSITSALIADGEIVNADISAAAAIDPGKISGTAWTANNDGAGSGLDADLLDGQEASAFLSTASDYGRSGVADSLFEGTTKLSEKYLGITAQAVDADKLDGLDSSAFADSAHLHDDRYYTEDELSTSGTINDSSNPVDWTKLKSVPAGFADGTDDGGGISQILEGDGIAVTDPMGPTTTIAAEFGSGSTQVARGDHDHDVVYVNEGQASSITGDMIIDGQIMNADVSAGAVIDPSKISGIAWTANNDGAGSGLDADLLDGQEAAAFMDTTNDYGRSGVASSLYEGTTALGDKYVNKDTLDHLDAADGNPKNVVYVDNDGDVRIGTASPTAKLHVQGTFHVGATGDAHDVNLYGQNAGSRMFWDASRMALRAGGVTGDQWDDVNVGAYSFASGYDTKASKSYSTAMGLNTTASGDYATALGRSTTASGQSSTAMGVGTNAGGDYSTAMGYYTTASGDSSTAMGVGTNAGGVNSTAAGYYASAGGGKSIAMGDRVTANGITSTAMGNFVTASATNSMVLGKGQSDALRLVNNISNSLIVGFGSQEPTLYVDGSSVGVGTNSTAAKLDVQGTVNVGLDDTGYDVNFYGADSGSRLFWDESKMALRAGQATGSEWDDANVGMYSLAAGRNTTASGMYSSALGYGTIASEAYSTAMGQWTTASGQWSTAIGYVNTASGKYSVAIGKYVTASDSSIVIGSGISGINRLVNDIENSLVVGFDDTTAALFVGGDSNYVGIGTTSPTEELYVVGDIYCTGKLTSVGGNDPPYVLYDKETREAIIERVAEEVPQNKLTGAVLFWNGEQLRFEVYLPERGEFRDLLGNLLAEVSELNVGLLDATR